jgi:hypothetical protein
MYKIQFLIHLFSRLYANYRLLKKNVFIISGPRRSGNHALISWLVDALENKNNVEMRREGKIWRSESGNTIHLNEVNYHPLIFFL